MENRRNPGFFGMKICRVYAWSFHAAYHSTNDDLHPFHSHLDVQIFRGLYRDGDDGRCEWLCESCFGGGDDCCECTGGICLQALRWIYDLDLSSLHRRLLRSLHLHKGSAGDEYCHLLHPYARLSLAYIGFSFGEEWLSYNLLNRGGDCSHHLQLFYRDSHYYCFN